MICAGIDAGSRAIKIVLLDAEKQVIVASGVVDQGVEQDRLAGDLFERLLGEQGIDKGQIARTVATGYGRGLIGFADTTITEISCHAAGVRHVECDARTVIDIGGQDSKLLRLDEKGRVRDFAMNDRCAAGTGRFLEIVAERFGVQLGDLGELASKSSKPAAISSMCVVFAETEIVGLLASGASQEDIVAGVQDSIAKRMTSMMGAVAKSPVVFTGGVAMIPGMDTALDASLKQKIRICAEPQLTGALGAAILAAREI
jgi:predicted CoA-substrate-specific enzyme activase